MIPTIIHPADVLDTYLHVCSQEQKFIEQALAAFSFVNLNGPVLDCAVGTGFGTLKLLQSGYNLVCSDGSLEMIEKFKSNCKSLGITNLPVHAKWEDLSDIFPEVFQLVMCRGNSLVYADSWDDQNASDGVDEHAIQRHVGGMAGALRPGGVLLVDIPKFSDRSPQEPLILKHSGLSVEGATVEIYEEIRTNRQTRRRHWNVEMLVDGEQYSFERSSYLLDADLLNSVLKECGFISVSKLPSVGLRDHYESWLAVKGTRQIDLIKDSNTDSCGNNSVATVCDQHSMQP